MDLTFGFDMALAKFQRLPQAMDQFKQDVLKDWALVVEGKVRENLNNGRPEWTPVKAASRMHRKSVGSRSRNVPLFDEGILAKSISHEVTEEYAMVGSTVDYAAVHEKGTKVAGAGRNVTIPKRPYFAPAVEESWERVRKSGNERLKRMME